VIGLRQAGDVTTEGKVAGVCLETKDWKVVLACLLAAQRSKPVEVLGPDRFRRAYRAVKIAAAAR
jgi:hypothetical protein